MNSVYTYLENISSLVTEIPTDSILSRTVLNDDQVKITLFGFAPGQELSEHTASMPAIIQILQGEASLTLGEDTIPAQAGTWVHMPANLTHALKANTPVIMLLTMIKARRTTG
jgi:quercetin dioxygenase-like cupin family protein